MDNRTIINDELIKLNTLLKSVSFNLFIAEALHTSYYIDQRLAVPSFTKGKEDIIAKNLEEQTIALNLAGFYATECGVGALLYEKGEAPEFWLKKIINEELDHRDLLLLGRFANATWKAAQPFISLERISEINFCVAGFLNTDEIKKDNEQVIAAAIKLLSFLQGTELKSKEEYFKKVNELLQDKRYAVEIAKYVELSYQASQKKEKSVHFNHAEQKTITKSRFEEEVAINLAGFYALECGLSFLADTENKIPSKLMKSIIEEKVAENDKNLFQRFANATWKAGQPFRSLDRITRKVFAPFDLLSKEEEGKSWQQIVKAADIVLSRY